MKRTKISAKLEKENKTVTVNVPVIFFIEKKIHIAYIPVLDLSGYGESQEQAQASLEHSLNTYFTYTHNKNTLEADLIMHGWSIKKKSKPFIPPEISTLLPKNPYLQEIFDSRKYTMDRMNVVMPQYANS